MKGSKSRNRGLNTRILASACLAGGAVVALPSFSQADVVINVGLGGNMTMITTTTGGSPSNGGVVPVTYTPTEVTVPDAPGQTYDAADTSDSGTIWNSIEAMTGNGTSSVSSILFEQDLPLVSSTGASTGAELNVSVTEGSGKSDYLHANHNIGRTGTDGLVPNPATSTYGASLVGDGYANTSTDQLVMGTNWITNSTGDGTTFELTGLTAYEGKTFTLYVYGAGTADGSGGLFTLASGNGGASASTNSNSSALNMSVFDSGGINPAPEKGLSWNSLTGIVDGNGDVTINVTSSVATVKSGENGFQIDLPSVPEPTTLALLGLGGMGLLARRRPKNNA
jgi:PEP-CTERM motif